MHSGQMRLPASPTYYGVHLNIWAFGSNKKFPCIHIHTYIHNWPKLRKDYTKIGAPSGNVYITYIYTRIIGHYNPLVMIINLASHTTYVVCSNFIHKQRDLQFRVDSERQIFCETFHGNFIYSQNFCQKSAERKIGEEIFFFCILF